VWNARRSRRTRGYALPPWPKAIIFPKWAACEEWGGLLERLAFASSSWPRVAANRGARRARPPPRQVAKKRNRGPPGPRGPRLPAGCTPARRLTTATRTQASANSYPASRAGTARSATSATSRITFASKRFVECER
jgi:hypothetical protein